jgi:hypothetical protein
MIRLIICAILGLHPCRIKSNLDILYADTNKTYFGNRLPKHPRIVQLGRKVDNVDLYALTVIEEHKGHMKVTIYFWPRTLMDLQSTMLHEQCHIVTWDELEEHGLRWRTCMEERGLKW